MSRWLLVLLMVPWAAGADAPKKPVRKGAPLEPSVEFHFKDSRQVQELIQKNKWFKDFRNSPLYDGGISRLAPVLFSLADEYGPSAATWKGRLLDHLYEQILKGKPVLAEYFNRPRLVSPVVLTFAGISSGENKVIAALVKAFRSTEDQEIEASGTKVKVTPLMVRGQRFALVLKDKCFSISRDPMLAALAGHRCGAFSAPASDAVVKVRLTQQFPSLAGLRTKFLGVDDLLSMDFKWNSSSYAFQPREGAVGVRAGDSPIRGGKLAKSMLNAVPAATFFYGAMILPELGGFGTDQIKTYFTQSPAELQKRKPMTVTLFYGPVDENDKEQKSKFSVGTAFLIQHTGANAKTMEALAALMKETGSGEVFMRPVCNDLIVLSNKMDMVRLTAEVCERKRPSLADAGAKAKDMSSAVFFSPGKMLARMMEVGWKASEASAMPEEIASGQRLLEALPEYLFSGSVQSGKVVLKPAN